MLRAVALVLAVTCAMGPAAMAGRAAAIVAAPAADSIAVAAPAPPDTTRSPRIVRRFPTVVVEGGRRADPASLETAYPLASRSLRELPVDRLADAVALQPGVVATGEDLHVRGGRPGELTVSVLSIPLNDPLTGRPMEIPLLAVRQAELLEGVLDADHRGSLAGELAIETEAPTGGLTGMARYVTDGGRTGDYDAALARLSGPLGIAGLGWALAGEGRLDDLGLPVARTESRSDVLGASLGWRSDNRLLGWARIASIEHPQQASIEVFGSRVLATPYDPMFSFDGWVTPVDAPGNTFPYQLSEDPIDSTSVRYRAGDHVVTTDDRRVAVLATHAFGLAHGRPARVTLGWQRSTDLASVGGRRDLAYTLDPNHPLWGPYGRSDADPFHVYGGDVPYFRSTDTQRWIAAGSVAGAPAPHQRVEAGAGLTYDHVRFTELDDAAEVFRIDSLRTFEAFAPGGYAYAQHRWELGGLIWNAGLRLQAFTAGPQAPGAHTHWTWSPRLGFAYPISVHDAFSLAYDRVHQDPDRELLYDHRVNNYDTHPLGNGALVPAEMASYQAAVKHILDPAWSLQLGVFYRDFAGEPGARNAPLGPYAFRLQYASADDGHAEGAELALRYATPDGQQAELAYTFMDAWGEQSSAAGLTFGQPVGARPLPLGEHPLDWDQRHLVNLTLKLHAGREWSLVWTTRIGSGLPWTPLPSDPGTPPPPYLDQSLINSRRLPWNEATDLSLRWAPPILFGGRALLEVSNVFDNRVPSQITLSGYPNRLIGTVEDDDTAFYTQTGLGGGAYFDGTGSQPDWVREFDPRLARRPRVIRVGVEIGG